MKSKHLFFALSLLIILSSVAMMHLISADSPPTLSVVLSGTTGTNTIPAQSVGSTFSVDVRVDNTGGISPGINTASFSVTWDPSVLNCTSTKDGTTFWGNKMSPLGSLPVDYTLGVATFGQIIVDTAHPLGVAAKTSGVLETLTFQVLRNHQSDITLQKSDNSVPYLTYPQQGTSKTQNIGINTAVINATYMGSTSNQNPPQVIFTPADGSILPSGSPVTLDASSSQPGNDTDNGVTYDITGYTWRVECLNGTTINSLNGKTATLNALPEGAYRITLIVTTSNPQLTGSASAILYVVSNPQATKIDVYTERGGMGPNVAGGQFGPLQTLQMYASVKNNNVSLSNQNVLFTIQNSNKSVIAVRQGTTNGTGIAGAQFRLPSPDPNSSQTSFGTWYITASVNLASSSVNDTSTFDFNYQSYLSGIQKIQIPARVNRLDALPIQLTVNSSYYPLQWSQLSITVVDQAGIPIGSASVSTPQAQAVTVINSNIIIPSWAFKGQATVYICLLTNSTNSQLVPLSPETLSTFDIA